MTQTNDPQDEAGLANPLVEPSTSSAIEAADGQGAGMLSLVAGSAPDPAAGETVFLELEDLLADDSGEVVLFAGEELPVNIVTDEPLTDAGIAQAHVTATGVDVTGHYFYSFENGVTLYSPTDLPIVTEAGTA